MNPRLLADEARSYVSYVRGIRRFLADGTSDEDNRRRVAQDLESRGGAFVAHLGRAVFDRPASPYGRLFGHAGVERGDAEALVRDEGVEGALDRLYEAGVYLTIDEFKGRAPIRRGSFELAVGAEDFDTPADRLATGSSGGSGGTARPIAITTAALEDTNAYSILVLEAVDLRTRPTGIVAPLPPSLTGLTSSLLIARLGSPTRRWFSQTAYRPDERTVRAVALLSAAWALSRARRVPSRGRGTPRPRSPGGSPAGSRPRPHAGGLRSSSRRRARPFGSALPPARPAWTSRARSSHSGGRPIRRQRPRCCSPSAPSASATTA